MAKVASRNRTICYVDGFNLYYGMRDAGLRDCYWLDIRQMAGRLVRPPFVLERTKYFTARVSGARPGDSPVKASEREDSRRRQALYLEALETIRALEIYEGTYLLKRESCRLCGKSVIRAEEKMTDVSIATEMLTDAFLDRFDSAVVVSADSDLAPPMIAIKAHFPHKAIACVFPPKRQSWKLRQLADTTVQLWRRTLERSQLPLEIEKPGGITLRRPPEWQ
jgi:uncharacterized LabA/DUF88 family protein